jgi:hypothetical protein
MSMTAVANPRTPGPVMVPSGGASAVAGLEFAPRSRCEALIWSEGETP